MLYKSSETIRFLYVNQKLIRNWGSVCSFSYRGFFMKKGCQFRVLTQGFGINTQISYKKTNRSNPFNHAYLAKQELLDVI